MSHFERRPLPVLKIHDTEFIVDIKALEFRQLDNPSNAISFRNVQDNDTHTQILYDPKTKNAFQGTFRQAAMRADVILIKLPARIDLDRDTLIDELNKLNRDSYNKRIEGEKKLNGKLANEEESGVKRKRKGRRI